MHCPCGSKEVLTVGAKHGGNGYLICICWLLVFYLSCFKGTAGCLVVASRRTKSGSEEPFLGSVEFAS